VVVQEPPPGVDGKGRMGLVPDSGLDADLVHAVCDLLHRRGVGERTAAGIQVRGPRHLGRGQRDQFVGPFEKVVLERRFVDLGGERRLVFAV
jgi:hypothetical protein